VKIAAWNVNSIRARLPNVVGWLKAAAPDVVLLQETKTLDETFPAAEIEDLGYNAALRGQKTYNGVAVLSKRPIDVILRALPGEEGDEEARYLEVFTGGLTVASVYVPQGQIVGTERFAYKLRFLERLAARVRDLQATEEAWLLGGDFNVAPNDGDVWNPRAMDGEVCFHPDERARLRRILYMGVTDAVHAFHPEPGRFSYWDYRGNALAKNEGWRIDHLLLSPQAADRVTDADVDTAPRALDKASDHAPVYCELVDR
jgi:exodeoxyribonuclease III